MKLNKKNKLLLAAFVLILFVCYRVAFLQTIRYREICKTQEAEIKENSEKNMLLPFLRKKDMELSFQIAQFSDVDTLSFQNELLKTLDNLAIQKGIIVKNFSEPHVINEKGTKITSYDFILEGGFNHTLELINDLENNGRLGFVKYMSFRKGMNYKNNSFYLHTEVILQRKESIAIN